MPLGFLGAGTIKGTEREPVSLGELGLDILSVGMPEVLLQLNANGARTLDTEITSRLALLPRGLEYEDRVAVKPGVVNGMMEIIIPGSGRFEPLTLPVPVSEFLFLLPES